MSHDEFMRLMRAGWMLRCVADVDGTVNFWMMDVRGNHDRRVNRLVVQAAIERGELPEIDVMSSLQWYMLPREERQR